MMKGIDFSKRKRKWIVALALLGLSSYGAYKMYHMPSVVRKRKRLFKLLGAMVSISEMVSDSSEAVGVVSRELKEFLMSDSDQIPNSLKQLSKIARSEEFSESVARITRAMTVGVIRGYRVDMSEESGNEEKVKVGFGDRVMDEVMSAAGTGFVSAVVGSFARNLVLGFYLNSQTNPSSVESSSSSLPDWVKVISNNDCKLLIADCIQTFVSTAVAVYLDKTMDVNIYDDLFSGLTNPKHETKVRQFLVSVCNGAVETLVKTSHQVLAKPKNEDKSHSYSTVNHRESPAKLGDIYPEPVLHLKKATKCSECNGIQNNGWVSTVSSTLAVPDNRKLVLDVTGRVTYETIRSLAEFLFWQFSDGLKRTFTVVNEEVLDKGLEVIRYVGAKSSVIVTICLALYLHIFGGSRALLPA